MAKRVGQVNESTGWVETRNVRRAKTDAIPWTVYDTPAKRAKRWLVG
jgi:hypothetical protein